MKKIFDPPKRIMKSLGGSKNPENQFFRPKSVIFLPISTKLSKSVMNTKTHILVFFLPELTPFIDVIEGSINPKNHFFGPNSIIFHPISMKLGTIVKNIQTHILIYFGSKRPPPWSHNRDQSNYRVPSKARRQKEISHSLRGRMARGAAPSIINNIL